MSTALDTARTTGLLYLGLAVTGAVGHLALGGRLFDAADPAGTAARLASHEPTARVALALELGIVVTQALTALWFYRLFRGVDAFAAGTLAVFGMVNAVAILGSAAAMGAALDVALAGGADAGAAGTLWLVSGSLWDVGGLFFGLWLVPMGWLVLHSPGTPRPLGWVLVVGGACYVAGTVVAALLAPDSAVVDAFGYPATVGELWIIGYLLVRGGRSFAAAGLATTTATAQDGARATSAAAPVASPV